MSTNKSNDDVLTELTLTKADGEAAIVNLSNVFTRHAEEIKLPLNEEILEAAKEELYVYAAEKRVPSLNIVQEYSTLYVSEYNVSWFYPLYTLELSGHTGTKLAASKHDVEVIQSLAEIETAKKEGQSTLHNPDAYQKLIDEVTQKTCQELIAKGKQAIDEIAARPLWKRMGIGFFRAIDSLN